MPPAVPVPALRRAAAPCFPPFIVAPAPAYVTVHFPRCVCPSIAQTQKALAFRPAPFCAPNPRCVRKLFSVLCAPHRLPVRRGRHRPPAQRPTPAAYPKRKKPRLSSRGPACAAKRRFLFYTPVLGFCFWPASPAGAGAVPSPGCAAPLLFRVLCRTKSAPFLPSNPARPYCPHPAFRPAPSRASGPHNGKPRTRRLHACTAPKMMVRAASPLYLLFPVPSVFLTSALFFVCCAAL